VLHDLVDERAVEAVGVEGEALAVEGLERRSRNAPGTGLGDPLGPHIDAGHLLRPRCEQLGCVPPVGTAEVEPGPRTHSANFATR